MNRRLRSPSVRRAAVALTTLALSACAWLGPPTEPDVLPLPLDRPGSGWRVSIADVEAEQSLGDDAATVPKPAKPRVPASMVRATRHHSGTGDATVTLQWKDTWNAALRIESDQPLDLRPFLAEGTLEFDVRAVDLARSGLNIAMSCGKDCGRRVNHVLPSRALAGRGWQHLAFPMRCFMRDGADFEHVSRPFVLESSGSGEVEVARVVIRRRGQPNASCADYRTQSVTPGPLDEIWSLDWWQARHAKKLQEIRDLRAAGRNAELVFIGDSITHGWEDAGKKTWEQFFAKYNALDLGFSGDRTENVLWRLQHGELDGIRPRVIVMMIGTNNTGDRQEDPLTTAAGIKRLIAEIRQRQPQARILLLAVFPRDEKPGTVLRKLNERLNGVISGYADDRSVFFLNINESLMNPDGSLSLDVMPDLLHLSEKGYGIWARSIEPTLNKLLATP